MNKCFYSIVLILLAVPLLGSCQTKKVRKAAPVLAPGNAPMTCRIEGKIVEVLKPADEDKGSICSRYPCRARVKILNVPSCGSSVTVPLNAGDTVTLRFTYSLNATAKLFPGMKAHYPGLRKGDSFSATAAQHLVMNSGGEFVVSAYVRK